MISIRAISAAILLVASSTVAMADTWSKQTKVTFSGPVQIPGPHAQNGVVTLPAGTYIFRLLDSSSNRNIVEVTNTRGNRVYSTILAINDYRLNATSKTVMYFTETKSGTPPAVKAWFYPGDNRGQRFVYPKVKAVQLAATVNQPVPSYEAPVVEKAKVEEIKVVAQTPAKQEVAYAPQTFEKVDTADTAGVDGEAVKPAPAPAAPAAEPQPTKLPTTASPLQYFGLIGAALLAIGFLFRRSAHQFE